MKKKHGEEVVDVSPELAAEWLAKSAGNRPLGRSHVVYLASKMHRGEWNLSSSIKFNTRDKLTDGHHRLHAIVMHGKPVTCAVRWGVPDEDVRTQDTGSRPRSAADQLKMYRPTLKHPDARVAATSMCAQLLIGTRPKIGTEAEFDAWHAPFKRGVDWAVDLCYSGSYGKSMRHAAICGPLAFAYVADPDMVSAFGLSLCTQTGLSKYDPAHTLFNFLQLNGFANGGFERLELAKRVLTAAHHHLNGQTMVRSTVQAGAVRFFVSQYDKGATTKLINKMLPFHAIAEDADGTKRSTKHF